jgi:hypothetical protein
LAIAPPGPLPRFRHAEKISAVRGNGAGAVASFLVSPAFIWFLARNQTIPRAWA